MLCKAMDNAAAAAHTCEPHHSMAEVRPALMGYVVSALMSLMSFATTAGLVWAGYASWHKSENFWRLQGLSQQSTVDMFANLCGFFFHFRDEAVPDNVKSWNVKRMVVDRNARHNDAQMTQEFFATIAKFLDARKNDPSHGKKGCKPSKLHYK